MKKIWYLIENRSIKRGTKNIIYILNMMLLSVCVGLLLWLIAGRFFLKDITWLICFMGYPAILLGLYGAIIYLYNHEFS